MAPISYPQTWDLASLASIPATPEFRQNLDRFKARLAEFAASTNQLPGVSVEPDVVAKWVKVIEDYELLDAQATDLRALIECYAAGDAENKSYQQLQAELSTLTPLREQIATNIEFALKEATDAEFADLVSSHGTLKKNEYFFVTRRKNAALRLPRPQELLAADLAVDGLHAWGRLFDRLSGALKVQVQEQGKIVTKSPGQVQFDSGQRQVRENNFFAADAAWATVADTCADAINHIAGTRLTNYRHVGLADHLVVPLRSNRMTRETLDSMWSTISAQKSVLCKYLAKKAELLGIERMAWWDVNAPLPQLPGSGSTDELTYDQACEQIIAAFQQFSPDFGDFARKALTEKWIEAENRKGKHQGGFCTSFPVAKQSRIFMTYTNGADSMSTLAHELGHA